MEESGKLKVYINREYTINKCVTPTMKPSQNLDQQISVPCLTSPYDEGMKRAIKTKLWDKRVYVPWYRAYNIGISDELNDFQPFDEIQSQDEDIALQHFFGERYLLYQDLKDPSIKFQRLAILRSYNKKKQRELAALEAVQIIDKSASFGPTVNAKLKLKPVLNYFEKLHKQRQRLFIAHGFMKPNSKWLLLKSYPLADRLRDMARNLKKKIIRKKFTRVISLVRNVKRFVNILGKMIVGDTQSMFKKEEEFTKRVLSLRNTFTEKRENMKERYMFNPLKYKINNEIGVSYEVKLVLTKPWYSREDHEVEKVVKCFQNLKSFVEYPPNYQRLIARTAWLMELPKNKVVIREGQQAYSFYFVITGRLKVTHLVGDPYYKKYSAFNEIDIIKAQDTFGEDCVSRPYSRRVYSVVTDEPTVLLSVNIHEVYNMELDIKDYEEAPEHIKFLSTLPFLESFPSKKLKEEADENITMFYFRPNVVITPDAAESEFVYVIFSGQCQVLVELPPSNKILNQYLNEENEKLEKAAAHSMRKKSSTWVRLIDNFHRWRSTFEQPVKFNKKLNHESLRPLMFKDVHKAMLENDIIKTKKRLAKFAEQIDGEVAKLNEKTVRVIAAFKKTSKKLPDAIEEWSKKFADAGMTMPTQFYEPPKATQQDVHLVVEDEDDLFVMDDFLSPQADSMRHSVEEPNDVLSRTMIRSPQPVMKAHWLDTVETTITFTEDQVLKKDMGKIGIQVSSPTAKAKKIAKYFKKYEPQRPKQRPGNKSRKTKDTKSKKKMAMVPTIITEQSSIDSEYKARQSLHDAIQLSAEPTQFRQVSFADVEEEEIVTTHDGPNKEDLESHPRIVTSKKHKKDRLIEKHSKAAAASKKKKPGAKTDENVKKKKHAQENEFPKETHAEESVREKKKTKDNDIPNESHSGKKVNKKKHVQDIPGVPDNVWLGENVHKKKQNHDNEHLDNAHLEPHHRGKGKSRLSKVSHASKPEHMSEHSAVNDLESGLNQDDNKSANSANTLSVRKPKELLLSPQASSTMPEISEIAIVNRRTSFPGRSVLPATTLTRNNSNITFNISQEKMVKRDSIKTVDSQVSSVDTSGTNSSYSFVPKGRKADLTRRKTTFFPAAKKVFSHSRWELHANLLRGDHIGTEWLDFNDRPFEPVHDKCAVIVHTLKMGTLGKSFQRGSYRN